MYLCGRKTLKMALGYVKMNLNEEVETQYLHMP